MDTQQKHLSYFILRLQELLNASFPEKENDYKYIEQRSSLAANAYEGAFLSRNTIDQYCEIANYIFFEGLSGKLKLSYEKTVSIYEKSADSLRCF